MDDIGSAIGTGLEGGLYAKAAGGGAGGKAHDPADRGHFDEEACLNCNATLVGPHCHQCGQEAHLHRTVGALFHDLLHGALHFEGKTWATLPALVFRPGTLTRRYIEGERKRYVSPIGIFLFSIFLMFAVFQAIGLTAPNDLDWGPRVQQETATAREQALAARDGYQQDMDAAPSGSPAYRTAQAKRDEANQELELIERAGSVITGEGGAMQPDIQNVSKGFWQQAGAKWEKNPGLMLYKLQSNGYKFSWMLIPISVPFMWLLFFSKRRFGTYDHAVFVTYSIAFMSLFFVLFSVLVKIGVPETVWGIMLAVIPPLHIYRQLRGAYALSRFSALWRLGVLGVFISFTIALFAQFLFLIGSF